MPSCIHLFHLLLATTSKIGASKVAGADAPAAEACAEPPMPVVVAGGDRVERAVSETHDLGGGRTVHMRALHDELQLTYVHNIASAAEIARLVELADARGGFIRSPLKEQAGGDVVQGGTRHAQRTSSSCPLLWPHAYANRRDAFADKPELLEELELAGNITERVAALLTAAGLETASSNIEPLQLVRYKAGELFGPHHDYHATGESSVQGEQRVMTVLVFGSTLAPEDGGETDFPHLGVSVSPRAGDAVAWMNVDMEGEPEDRSLHQGKPPLRGEKVAINVWIADQPFDLGEMGSAVRT